MVSESKQAIRSEGGFQPHSWESLYGINLPSDLGGRWVERTLLRCDEPLRRRCHHSVILSVILRWAPRREPADWGGLIAWNSEGGKRSTRGRNGKGHDRSWRILTDGGQKNPPDSHIRRKVSWLLSLSITLFYAAVIHSVGHLISLSVSLLLCQLVCHSASLTVSRSSSLPVTRSPWTSLFPHLWVVFRLWICQHRLRYQSIIWFNPSVWHS